MPLLPKVEAVAAIWLPSAEKAMLDQAADGAPFRSVHVPPKSSEVKILPAAVVLYAAAKCEPSADEATDDQDALAMDDTVSAVHVTPESLEV